MLVSINLHFQELGSGLLSQDSSFLSVTVFLDCLICYLAGLVYIAKAHRFVFFFLSHFSMFLFYLRKGGVKLRSFCVLLCIGIVLSIFVIFNEAWDKT